eukprot:TRINITY_DN11756_c0_g2_i8.p1 TRINITY_DN11756_c0_g2~~TRINITY_DN11756_c0_g2_i8.p1  ORF type:complete len:126 (-),score=18.04 TRINITY_DN11756_c0_g2_i8:273-650(-)
MDVNAKWLDNLMQEVNAQNESIKLLTKAEYKIFQKKSETIREEQRPIKDPSVYLEGFKGIQSEFASLKSQMKNYTELQRNQGYEELVKEVRKAAENVAKISNDNQIIQSEHSELMKTLRFLSTSS